MSTYQVSLDVFEGPLDVLLRLIEQEKLDITLVSLALVTDQFLAHIASLHDVAAANLADFLVIAARLIVIKSRVLLPKPQIVEDEEEEDWGAQLVERLREYKRFKGVASRLRDTEELGLKTYPRIAPPPHVEKRLRTGDVTLDELFEAFKRALASHPPVSPVDDVVTPVVVRIADCIKTLLTQVRRHGRTRFSTLMRRARSRMEIIVTFLALLEMVKQQRVRTTQEQPFSEIYIEARKPDPDADIPPLDLSEYGEPQQEL